MTAGAGDREEKWQRLCDLVEGEMVRHDVPGVAVGVLSDGQAQTRGWGVTSVEHPLDVTAGTLFQVGSITKTFTGTLVMRLVEEGKLDLDVPVRTYLPEFRVSDDEATERATLRHLLTHMGGWAGDFFRCTGSGDDALARYVAAMADLPQLAPIGTHWSYNNAGFSLAGYLVEKVTGQPFERVMKDLVLDPLGLEHVYFRPEAVMTHRFAVGHEPGDGGPQVARPWMVECSAYPVGGIVTRAGDLLRYAQFHLGSLHGDVQIVSRAGLEAMQTPQVTLWGDEQWGLTWAINQVGGTRQLTHGGGTKGQVSLLVLVPERQFAMAILTNSARGGKLNQALRRFALGEYLGIEDPEPKPIESSPADLSPYAGHYTGYYTDVDLGMVGEKLVGQITYKRGFPNEETPPAPAPPPMSVGRCAEDRLLVLDGPFKDVTGDVVRLPDGEIGWLRISGRLHRRA
ncbi:MAG: beta-lactamase family protein [Anaerolineae bacterium]|nr:beta-lactamase family protein [Anaerolineae bacterium]